MKKLKLQDKFLLSFMSLALIVAATGTFGFVINKWVNHKIQSALKSSSAQENLVLRMEVNLKICQVHLLEASKVIADMSKFEDFAEDYQAKKDIFRGSCDLILKGNQKLGIEAAPDGSVLQQRVKSVNRSWTKLEQVADSLLARKKM